MANRQNRAADKAAQISAEDKARIDMLHIQVNSLVPAEPEVMKQQLRTLCDSFLAACTVDNVLSYAIESLLDSCLESRSLCEKVAILFQALLYVGIGQTKVRSVILTWLQNNFSNLKELQETNNKQWLNSIAVFVAIFHHVRYANGQHLIMLASFIIQALQPLLSGDEAEMKLLAESVISNGLILREGASEEFDQLLVDIRTTLIQRNLSSECRLWLLLTADVAEVNFGSLRVPILQFYKGHLGESILPMLDAGAKNKYNVVPENAAEDVSSAAPASPRSPKTPVAETASRKSPEKSNRRGSEPRYSQRPKDDLVDKVQSFRINAGDIPKKSDKLRNFASAMNYASKSKGRWDHDDRFDNNEYEAPQPRPDRAKSKKTVESPEKPQWSNRPERSDRLERSDRPDRPKIPEGSWRQSSNKESKERVQDLPKLAVPVCEEVWD